MYNQTYMSSEPSSIDAASTDDAIHELENLLHDIAQRARADISPRQFYSELLPATVRAVAAVAGAVWVKGPRGSWQVEYQINLSETGLLNTGPVQSSHARLLDKIAADESPELFSPQEISNADHSEPEAENNTAYLLVLAPVLAGQEVTRVLELFQRANTSPATARGNRQFLSAMSELAADFQQATRLRELTAAEGQWNRWANFSQQIHDSLDSQATAYALANEARRLIGCDRVCVLIRSRRLQLAAVSGTESFDRRSNFTRNLEALAEAALVTKEELWIEEDWQTLPPEVELPLQTYLDESHVRSVGILPLFAPRPKNESHQSQDSAELELIGALVLDQFQAGMSQTMRDRARLVQAQGATALRNALEVERLPFSRTLRSVGQARWWMQAKRWPKALVITGVLLGVVLALTLIPAELRITARGELQPEMRREVFAPLDGVVDSLSVEHGQQVTSGQTLLQLRSPDLELQQRRIEGETQTALKRLESLAAARVGKRFTTDEQMQEYQRLTAEEEEVKAELAGLAQQEIILTRQQEELTIKSPVQGEVLTWDVANLLTARPVAKGQALLLVAKVDGDWVLELNLPDAQSQHVLSAWQQAQKSGDPVHVTYMLATRPGEQFAGEIQQVAQATQLDTEQQPVVRVTIKLDPNHLPELRPGATAVAQIDCGQNSLGYVWLHDLIDTTRTWLFF